MGYSLRQASKQKNRLTTKILIFSGTASALAFAVYFFSGVFILDKESAPARNLMMDDHSEKNGEIIIKFSWDNGLPAVPDIGPAHNTISPEAECIETDSKENKGLSAGREGRDIRLILDPLKEINPSGVAISFDFKRMEPSCTFISRGKDFKLFMEEGILLLRYKLTAPNGKSYMVVENTGYEIAADGSFKTIQFQYIPSTGRGEVLVEGLPVWTHQGVEGSRLCWNIQRPFVIGEEMNGDGKGIAILDNLIITNTGKGQSIPLKLLSFTAEPEEGHVMLNWFTSQEKGTDYFVIEKSEDTRTFIEIGRVKASVNSEKLKAYAFADKDMKPGIYYYRLGLSNHSAQSNWVPVIALRIKPPPPTTSEINGTNQLKREP